MTKENTKKDTYSFKAEISKVLDIVIHSLYTDRSIFVRELVSNAADALEKMRHIRLTEDTGQENTLKIDISLDKENKIFSIRDNGIGMTQEELKKNLGTVAHSGVIEYLEKVKDKNDLQLIGQFGVGFYSAFMVAEKVEVISKSWKKNASAWKWTSDGKTGYSIEETDHDENGTIIKVYLKKDNELFIEKSQVETIIKKYSSFIPFDILIDEEKTETVQAIWKQLPSELKDEDYKTFYSFMWNDFSPPSFWIHFSTDAPISLDAILYFPGTNMEKFGLRGPEESEVSLYCKKVLIEPQAKDILPKYLRFVKGVIDSEDLPLNISRETLQDNTIIRKISRVLTSKIIKVLSEKMKKDKEKYNTFYTEFSRFIKEGVASDLERKEKLAQLLLFESLKNEEKITLDQYIENKKEDQEAIYYLMGADRKSLENSPYMELFKKNDTDVLFSYEPVDEFVFQNLMMYKDLRFVSADTQGANDISNEEKEKENKALIDWIKETLEGKIKDVKVSSRLTDSPVMLVSENMSHGMQRVMEAMGNSGLAMNDDTSNETLEINPEHNIIKNLDNKRDKEPELAQKIVLQLLDNAKMMAGFSTDVSASVGRINEILEDALK